MNASTLYLCNPVHAAYQMIHPEDKCLNEVTRPRRDGTPSSRVDKAYFRGKPNETKAGESTNIFALMEFKRYNGINRNQLKEGIVTSYNAFDAAQTQSRYNDPDSEDESQAEVATMQLKQAVHYVYRYNTPFVAISDWKTLVLLVMSKQEKLAGGDVRTASCPLPRRPANTRFSTPI